jgi:hypothetical protein
LPLIFKKYGDPVTTNRHTSAEQCYSCHTPLKTALAIHHWFISCIHFTKIAILVDKTVNQRFHGTNKLNWLKAVENSLSLTKRSDGGGSNHL